MSSIYEALRRSRATGPAAGNTDRPAVSSRGRVFRLVASAVIVSSVLTAAVVYHAARNSPGPGRPAAQAQSKESAADPGVVLDLMSSAERQKLKGDLEGALEAYRDVVRRAPGYVDAYLRLGEVYYLLGRYDQAKDALAEGLRRKPLDARMLNNMGSVLLATGKAAEALAYFTQARRNSAEYVEPLYNMACAYARMNRKDAALSALRQAAEMQPEVRLWAARDADLATLAADREFKAIVHPEQ